MKSCFKHQYPEIYSEMYALKTEAYIYITFSACAKQSQAYGRHRYSIRGWRAPTWEHVHQRSMKEPKGLFFWILLKIMTPCKLCNSSSLFFWGGGRGRGGWEKRHQKSTLCQYKGRPLVKAPKARKNDHYHPLSAPKFYFLPFVNDTTCAGISALFIPLEAPEVPLNLRSKGLSLTSSFFPSYFSSYTGSYKKIGIR